MSRNIFAAVPDDDATLRRPKETAQNVVCPAVIGQNVRLERAKCKGLLARCIERRIAAILQGDESLIIDHLTGVSERVAVVCPAVAVVENLKRILDKAYRWFRNFKRFLNMERECLEWGFSMEQTDKLLHGQAINYSGWLHSNEYRRNVLADNVTAQVIRDEKRNLFLHINQTPFAQWFKEQFGIGQEQRRGIKR